MTDVDVIVEAAFGTDPLDPPVWTEPVVSDAVAELNVLLASSPAVGPWVVEATCASLGLDAAESFVADRLGAADLAMAARICRHCPVQSQCADYAARAPVWGLWAGVWHDGKAQRQRAA